MKGIYLNFSFIKFHHLVAYGPQQKGEASTIYASLALGLYNNSVLKSKSHQKLLRLLPKLKHKDTRSLRLFLLSFLT